MATSIPADPRLSLGCLAKVEFVRHLKELAKAEKPKNTAQELFNSLMLSKRNIENLYHQLKSAGVDVKNLEELQLQMDKSKIEISASAVDLAVATITAQSEVKKLKKKRGQTSINAAPASPLDFKASKFIQLPLSSDSMKMDVQYFRNEQNIDRTGSHAAAVATYVSNTFSGSRFFGPSTNSNLASSAHEVVTKQTRNHSIQGTIIITARCTHRQGTIIDPFILDPIKALSAWNEIYPDDQLETDPETIFHTASDKNERLNKEESGVLHMISGATFGSSFIGMIHVLQVEKTNTGQDTGSIAAALESMMTRHLAIVEKSGSFGVTKEFAKGVVQLVSSSKLLNHCSLITEGIVPNIVSNTVTTSVASLKPNAKEIMAQLAAIQGASSDMVNTSMEAMGKKSKIGAQFMKLNSNYLESSVSSLGTHDNEKNKIIDMNSLMTAFEDYVEKANEGASAIPINYFIREISKCEIAKAYISKYYPGGATTTKQALAGRTRNESGVAAAAAKNDL